MLTFWLLASTLVVIALAFVLPPLFGLRKAADVARDDVNVSIFRQRLTTLDAQVDAGELEPAARDQAELEWKRTLLEDVGDGEPGADQPGTRGSPIIATVVAVLIPLLASGLYLAYGSPGAVYTDAEMASDGASPGADPAVAVSDQDLPSVADMVGRLETRLQANPGDAEGWVMLGRSFLVLKQFDKARDALVRADAVRPNHAVTLLTLAEVIAGINGDQLAGEPAALIKRAVSLEPNLPHALWLAGFAALSEGEPAAAVAYWQRLSASGSVGAEQVERLQSLIAFAQGRAGAGAQPSGTEFQVEPVTQPGLRVFVSIADQLIGRVDEGATVFVFARALEGPPMPLAVARLTPAQLPTEVLLDDSMAMMAERRLSAFSQVVVGARISASGNALPSSRDLQGLSGVVSVAAGEPVAVVINSVVP